MRALRQIGMPALLLLLAGWCAFHFRADWQQMSISFTGSVAWAIALAAMLSIVNYALRAFRWSIYLARLGHFPGLGFAATTYIAGFAFAISPGKIGELARSRYYVERGMPFRDLAAIALMERVMDVIAMLTLATLALSLLRTQAIALAAVAVLVALVLVFVAIMPARGARPRMENTGRLPQLLSSTLDSVSGAMRSARSLLSGPCILAGLLIGVAAWGCEGIGLYVLSGLSAHASALPVTAAVGIYAVSSVAGAATFVPGGLGGTEAVMTALLSTTGMPTPDALAITLVCRLSTLWLAVAIGWAAVGFLELQARRHTACIPVRQPR